MSNIKNIDGFRRCYLCDQTFPATSEYFPLDKNRLLGLGYQCRPCAKLKSKERQKPRPLRWQEMTPENKEKRKATQKKHIANGGWRAMRVGAYKIYDAKKGLDCDLTSTWFKENIQCKSCIYCKRTNVRIGCDRVNNKLGHTKANVVPSCGDCNKCRQDIFSHEEMLILGPHIALIFINRNWKTTY